MLPEWAAVSTGRRAQCQRKVEVSSLPPRVFLGRHLSNSAGCDGQPSSGGHAARRPDVAPTPPRVVRRRLAGRSRPLLRLGLLHPPNNSLPVLHRNRRLAHGEPPHRQLAALAQHRRRAVEGLRRLRRKEPNASSRLVASSMNTISVHAGARPSNQSRGEPSIRTGSPRHARRGRLGRTRTARRSFGFHNPSAIIHCRSVSTDDRRPCTSTSFSRAKVGPKSGQRSRTRAVASRRTASARALFEGLPQCLETSPGHPRSQQRASSRLA